MKNQKLQKLITAAALAALICVATLLAFPIPGGKGYVNAGDAVVLLAAFLLGPVYGMLAGGLGSALADLFLGYAFYAPGTFVIKGLTALFAALIFRALRKKTKLASLPAALAGELWMPLGYFAYESAVLGLGLAAVSDVPANLLQAAGGVVLSQVLFHALSAAPPIRKFMETR